MQTRAWRPALFAALGLLVAAWVVVVATPLEDQLFPRRFATVEPGRIYRSGRIAPRLLPGLLNRYRIGLVIDLTRPRTDDRADPAAAEQMLLGSLGVRRVEAPLNGDGTGNVANYAYAVAEIARAYRAGVPVLVHCDAGRRRSAGVIAAFQMAVRGKTRGQVEPELRRFLSEDELRGSALETYLDEHLDEIRAALVAQGVAPARAGARPAS